MVHQERRVYAFSREYLLKRIERARRQLTDISLAEGLRDLRSIQNSLTNRFDKVFYSLRAAAIDPEVTDYTRSGAEHYSAGRFEQAEYEYWRCTQIYPFHSKFAFEYAHTLFLQNKFIDCEVFFRNALALGETIERVRPHLKDAAKRRSEPYIETPKSRFEPQFIEPINTISSRRGDVWLYPDLESLRTLLDVMTGQRGASTEYFCKLLRSCRTFWDAFVFILETPEFRSANIDLCYLLGSMPRIQGYGSPK